jgi:Holliday junction resolvase RusA-like endonuclease
MVEFTVPGPPVAAARARFARVGNHVRTYSPGKNVDYMARVRDAFLRQVSDEALSEAPFPRGVPLSIEVVFYFPRPKGHYGTGKNANRVKASAPQFHTTKPDVDNCIKLLKDALKWLAWHDDSQIARYSHIAKVYVESNPRTEIQITALHDDA